jgi:hypothetical protein
MLLGIAFITLALVIAVCAIAVWVDTKSTGRDI